MGRVAMKKTRLLQLLVALLVPGLGLLSAPAPKRPPSPALTAAPNFKRVFPNTPSGITCATNVIAVHPGHTVTLVTYVPDRPGTYPAILDLHGGGPDLRLTGVGEARVVKPALA